MERSGVTVNDHWQQMKDIMMETAEDICGMTNGPRRHKETWWQTDGVEFNAPLDTVQVISEAVFTANHSTDTDKQNSTGKYR